jgi:hypothetical protein
MDEGGSPARKPEGGATPLEGAHIPEAIRIVASRNPRGCVFAFVRRIPSLGITLGGRL